ncbi:DUF6152 family protein [Caldimonas tepidiphila]|uniref:DUF6152 family protein n=1 Tax=Caldimonas tepidiphila TaxID=2315841 RepID=UPI000E5A922B|nr:DUF6152 family protein [Caldimonas tepidiphila]
MQRRHLLIAAAGTGLFARLAQAHHGWSNFDETQPVYLEGRAAQVRWRNPHAEILLELEPQLALPPDLARRPLPPQAAPVDGPALLARAALPQRPDRRWTVELAPLTRLGAWGLGEIAPGAELSVVGFVQKQPQGEARLRAEYLFVGGKAYGLRSAPA